MRLVIEFHYTDGDIGAYSIEDDLGESAPAVLWSLFSPPKEGHAPDHIIIRLAEQDE